MTSGLLTAKVLRLNIKYHDPGHWHAALTGPNDELLTDHTVALNLLDDPSMPPWTDALIGTVTDARKHIDEARRWIGDHLLGSIGPRLLEEAPVTVRVRIPKEASMLLHCPLELAAARDPYDGTRYVPLAEGQVGFIFEHVDTEKQQVTKTPVRTALRILAIFSEPAGGSGSILHREWRGLPALLERIGRQDRRSIEVRRLVYDATQEDLESALADADGWDIVYLCGHDLDQGLTLRGADGSATTLPAKDLLAALSLTKTRLKVLVISDRTLVDHAALLAQPSITLTVPPTRTLVRQALSRLECPVVTFRWQPCEEFSTAFVLALFRLLTRQRQPLLGAVPLAVRDAAMKAVQRVGWCCVPGVVIHGASALGLALEPPHDQTPVSFDPTSIRFVGFPQPSSAAAVPIDFMRQTAAALIGDDSHSGILILGNHDDTFQFAVDLAHDFEGLFLKGIWYDSPQEPDVSQAFEDLVRIVDSHLDDLRMGDHLVVEAFTAFLLKFGELLRERPLLIVMANVDRLLDPDGDWRDLRFGKMVNTLSRHGGDSRLIMTGARAPNGLGDGVRVCEAPAQADGARRGWL